MSAESPAADLPRFRRARGFRLYDMRGRRYLDMCRDGALLGHRGAAALTVMKAVLSQGLTGTIPTPWEGRLAAALARAVHPFSIVRLYSSLARALDAISLHIGKQVLLSDVFDPALCPTLHAAPPAAFWRPLLPPPSGPRALLPLLPLSVNGAPAAACFTEEPAPAVPPSDHLPGFIAAGALRGLAALADPAWPARLAPGSDAVARALDGSRGWARVGPYVRALFPPADYPRVHAEFLRAGVLLCPRHPGPSVLPGDCSPGENRLLAELFDGIPGG